MSQHFDDQTKDNNQVVGVHCWEVDMPLNKKLYIKNYMVFDLNSITRKT